MAGMICFRESANSHWPHDWWPRDFGPVWFAARTILHGGDPYPMIGRSGPYEWGSGLLYPLPAALVAIPLAPFSEPVASALFAAIGGACLAWALMQFGYGPLFGFFAMPVREAAGAAQWSMLFASSLVLWPLSLVLVAKPTLGLAMFIARPTRTAVIGAVLLSAIAFLILPTWVPEWLAEIRRYSDLGAGVQTYRLLVGIPGGILILLCLMRWRRPEARLVVALACAPLNLVAYEMVPLLLVPRTFRQAALLVGLSYARHYLTPWLTPEAASYRVLQQVGAQSFVLLLYWPVTWMILRRPNEGAVPAWLERRIVRWPRWLRGDPGSQVA